ncbi:LysR family transcriptional regulator [Actinokineospora bangkokensis]|uniref:LysR family transcriptional regulator n=1 Tax=Actinokineospora bangkokensis TaxID=1193682 RepID=A0A1Q9LEW9_9PSEU|nr:LysR family transcriptional regulator [Actinokineospora bangkokensis]OLR90560.1 LysR family transcriptional regulator [Actinokineospora bangkokensis]
MLDVRRMQVLRAVVTCGSVTAAAANLGYTPSAVSQQIAALERQAGIRLLERHGRGVRPTEAGRLLTEHAAIIGKHVAAAETALADLRAGRTGRLGVRCFATAGATLVPPALARMRERHPGVRVDLKLEDPDISVPDVLAGRADLAVVLDLPDGVPEGLALTHLLDDPYRLVLPRGHRLAARRVVDLVDLAEEPWVGNEPLSGICARIVRDACAAAGFTPDRVVESDDYPTCLGFVAAGVGISLVPGLGLGTRHPGVVVRRVRGPEPVRSIYAAVRAVEQPPAALADLIEALREAATT